MIKKKANVVSFFWLFLKQHFHCLHGCDGLGHGTLKKLFEFMKLSAIDDLSHQHNKLVGLIIIKLIPFDCSTSRSHV
jgi:hypothetical protein